MSVIKGLMKDTAIYGVSSMLGRFLNWLLVFLYARTLIESDMGMYTNIYALTAVVLVILTYGMETGFFRFANKEGVDPNKVYTTILTTVGISSLIFLVLVFILLDNITLKHLNKEFILIMAIVVAMDAFLSIPFAYLRYKNRPIRFASIKLLFVISNIALNLFFLLLCPKINKSNPELISWFYKENFEVGYIFISNLISSAITFIALLPQIFAIKFSFDKKLLKEILQYSFPLLLLGLAGVLNQNIDKIIYPFLSPGKYELMMSQLGIYGTCFKVAIVMVMFVQAFRFAYEPFVFSKVQNEESKQTYSDAMKYFTLVSFFIFLGVTYFLDVLKYVINDYYQGIHIVPIIMLGELFFGIYFNLSIWYKLTDKTKYGAYFSAIGCVIIISLNVIFVPQYGYIASAWAFLISNFVMMVLSYIFGQKYYPINYQLKPMAIYALVTAAFVFIGMYPNIENELARWAYRAVLLLVYCFVLYTKEFKKVLAK